MGVKIWEIIIGGGIITYLIRLSFIALIGRLSLPEWFSRSLRYVPAAVLTAITVPELTNWNGKAVNITWNNPQLIAGTVAILVAWRTRNVVLTLAVGLLCFLLLHLWM